MKKKCMFGIFVFLLISSTLFGQNTPIVPEKDLPAVPSPPTAVSDFINIIDDNAQVGLEKRLSDFYDSTKIAIVVVTVQSVGEYVPQDYALSLGRYWGVGDKETNRGIVLMFAADQRAVEIAVGYGCEGFITDLESQRIMDNDIIPICKQGDYSAAMITGADKIMAHLGVKSWDDRMAEIAAQKAEDIRQQRIKKQNTIAVLWIIGGLMLFALFCYGIYCLIRYVVVRRKVSKELQVKIEEMNRAGREIDNTLDSFTSEPQWAQQEAKIHMDLAKKALLDARASVDEVQQMYRKKPREAMETLITADAQLDKAFASYQKAKKGLKEKIAMFSAHAESSLANALTQVDHNLDAVKAFAQKGYRVNEFETVHDDLKKEIAEYTDKLVDREFHQEIYTASKLLIEQSANSLALLQGLVSQKSEIDAHLPALQQQATVIFEKLKKYDTLLDGYEKEYLPSIWASANADVAKAIAKLTPDRLQIKVEQIVSLASMQTQKFAAAYDQFQEIRDAVDGCESLFDTIDHTKKDQDDCKANYPSYISQAKKKVDEALAIIKDSDVESTAKSYAKEAKKYLDDAELQAKRTQADWVMISQLLSSAISKAKDAISKANDDIDEAEDSRRRSRIRSTTTSTISIGGGGGGFSGGGGFGGFGGGSFGGGGASGRF